MKTKRNLFIILAAVAGMTITSCECGTHDDTVHEMARDEARHGKAFKGLLERYFG